MKIGDTFKKFMDTTAEIETKLGNPMACFLEEQEREEKLHLLMVDNHIPAGAKLY